VDAELPRDVVGRRAPRADPARVDAVKVVRRAHGDAVVAAVVAAVRAEEQVMVVQIPAGAAPGHGAPPAVAREDRIAINLI